MAEQSDSSLVAAGKGTIKLTLAEPEQGLDQEAHEAKQHEGIAAWVKENLGGDVIEFEREERWRPQWKVTYTKGDETGIVFVRGDRPITNPHMLHNEMLILQALKDNGIKVPAVLGWIESPKAIVLEFVDTPDARDLAYVTTGSDTPTSISPDRWQAMLSYMDHMAQFHAVPVSEFTHIRGFRDLDTPEEIALRETERYYRTAEQTGDIDPPLAFVQKWLRRNVPQHRTKASFIAGDSGQFMSDGPEVLALTDFEIACIGDSLWDLACLRGRHPYENMGDIPALYRRYAEATGEEVDLPVVAYHTANFLQLSALAAKWFMMPEVRGANWMEGLYEGANITRRTLEAIAELRGITLDYDLHLPEAAKHPLEESGLQKLVNDISRLPTNSSFAEWERDILEGIPKFLLNNARYREWFEKETIADIAQVTGASFDDLTSADEAILAVIEADDPSRDDDMVRILHRRTLRLSMIIAGTDPDDQNPFFHILDPIL